MYRALGSHILRALTDAGYTVTAVQRKDSMKAPPQGVASIKVDLSSKNQLVSAFQGMDAVVSAVPNPILSTEKTVIDAAIQAAVKRIIPSEFSTNMESAVARKLPILHGKSEVRDYITSIMREQAASSFSHRFDITSIFPTGTGTTWSSVNNGPFIEMCLKFGSLGPSIAQKTAVFHNGGDNVVGTSRLSDIAIAVAKVLDPAHFEETANTSIYMYSAAISERYLTQLASEVAGVEFKVSHVDTEDLTREADAGLEKGDGSKMFYYYFQMMYGKGYGGDTRHMSWNERLGLKTMSEDDIKDLIRQSA
ncbi:hypothetical protein SLS56_005551 [Neofusicoccum ribis]|uniref:NmrA-like domain-containing protein n=1 Tax=Neofusicoccum ribis TaxID=45134 RepID=A0ABR3ST58_9PEZI